MDTENQPLDYLVVIETQKTKQYLFASPYLRETRGSSVLLDLLNRKKTEELLKDEFVDFPYKIIYLGGGSGRVLFGNLDHAEKFKQKLIELYRDNTVNARIAAEVLGRPNKEEKFTEWVRHAVQLTQQQKLGQTMATPILAGRWIKPCTSCGREMAEHILTEFDEHCLCQACKLKREEINHLYGQTKPGQGRPRPLAAACSLERRYTDKSIFTTLAKYNEKDNKKIFLPQDFDDIGKYSKPANYMGFIYADGNSMGELIKKMGDKFPTDSEAKEAYRAFSEIVDQATREAAVEAVLEAVNIQENDKDRYIPAEFIIAGGDDLMLAVPAHNALDVAILFIEKFKDKTRQLQCCYVKHKKLARPFAEDGLTVSAGIVLAHSHYPASDLMKLSADLMKLAKRKAAFLSKESKTGLPKESKTGLSKESKTGLPKESKTGTLDFMVLYESATEAAGERRRHEYLNKFNQQQPFDLTERPYTVDAARQLLETIRELKKSAIPRSKLKALYATLFQSPWQAMFEGQRIKERLKVTGDLDKNSLHDLVNVQCFPFRYHDCIWHSEQSGWSTPLTEIIELYDFVHTSHLRSIGSLNQNPCQ